MVLKAILAACEDAGMPPRNRRICVLLQRPERADQLAAALGTKELRYSNMNWGGGGGGVAAAIGNAAAAVACGYADCVVAFRGLAQGQFRRFGQSAPTRGSGGGHMSPYGVMSPLQKYAMRAMRFMHENNVDHSVLRSISMASYQHAQNNPRP